VIYVIGEICELCGDVYMMMFVILDDACTLGDYIWWWLPCLYLWNDKLFCWVD